jgi:multiple sugar transport system permease protein
MSATSSHRSFYGLILVTPFLVTLLVFFVYALIRALAYSFTDYNLFNEPEFVGVENFLGILKDKLFVTAFFNTVLFAVIVTSLQTLLALGLAVVIGGNFFGKQFFRVAFYVPSILSSAAVTLVFIWFYQNNGFLNGFLSDLLSHRRSLWVLVAGFVFWWIALVAINALRGRALNWFDPALLLLSGFLSLLLSWGLSGSEFTAAEETVVSVNWLGTQEYFGPLPRTMWAIVLQNIFTTVPTFMLLFLAGVQGIPKDLYEAATIDGASRWRQFLHITVPQLAPVTYVVVTFGVIGTLQMFDQVALMGEAAPLESRVTLAYYVYHSAFPPGGQPHVGIASASALILAAITLAVVYLQKLMGVREKANG